MATRTETSWRLAPDISLVPGVLVGLAACGWWGSTQTANEMAPGMVMGSSMGRTSVSFAAFVFGWVPMMEAMMFPAILPVVTKFRRPAIRGQGAPTSVFMAGYLD